MNHDFKMKIVLSLFFIVFFSGLFSFYYFFPESKITGYVVDPMEKITSCSRQGFSLEGVNGLIEDCEDRYVNYSDYGDFLNS